MIKTADFHRILMGTILSLFLLACLSGCANTRNLWARIWGSETPGSDYAVIEADSELAARAQERLSADDYAGAAELFQQLKDQYPQSPYAAMAELRLGDSYYLNSKYEEAYGAYDSFISRHPLHENVPYAIYQKGMCWYQRMNGIDRDQTPTVSAITEFTFLVEVYPDSPYANMAHARVAEARNSLAGHEYYVGEYYFKRKDYAAAMRRFMGLIKAYPDSGYHPRAYTYIAQYREMLDSGEIEEGNLRGSEYDNPFSVTESSMRY
ncbi:MAG: outer membrane protein assembly factor BamD [Deltaproteobacteria bacterium]|nr:outer membrane protein assembly factor BamD [Deltaproteobacteria bacterium]